MTQYLGKYLICRLIVLEVLVNHLKGLTGEEDESETNATKLPVIGNLQHIAEHYKNSAGHILTMQDRGNREDLVRRKNIAIQYYR